MSSVSLKIFGETMKLDELITIISSKTGRYVNQTLLAEALGITRQTVSNRIKHDSQVTVSELKRIEEFFEILTLKQLCRHNKPIAIYNLKGYYNELLHAIEKATEKNFIRGGCLDLFCVSEDLNELFAYIEKPQEQKALRELKDG